MHAWIYEAPVGSRTMRRTPGKRAFSAADDFAVAVAAAAADIPF